MPYKDEITIKNRQRFVRNKVDLLLSDTKVIALNVEIRSVEDALKYIADEMLFLSYNHIRYIYKGLR